jgi:hypothetical protein
MSQGGTIKSISECANIGVPFEDLAQLTEFLGKPRFGFPPPEVAAGSQRKGSGTSQGGGERGIVFPVLFLSSALQEE